MKELRILGINVTDRIKESGATQKILSEFLHCIKTRLGFHELTQDVCSRNAFIILQLTGQAEEWDKLEDRLKQVTGLVVKSMNFNV